MKKKQTYLFALIGLAVALFAFKKPGKKTGVVYVDQTDSPAGSRQVYSYPGTNVYSADGGILFQYDTGNIGMTVINNLSNGFMVSYGDVYSPKNVGIVLQNAVQII